MLKFGNSRGDTIIEVLLAMTIFSIIAVGGMSLMNQGVAIAQRSLEIGLVREQIDSQADALRYLNKSYTADYGNNGTATDIWNSVVVSNNVPSADPYDEIVDGVSCNVPTANKAFSLDVTKLSSNPILVPTSDTATYARIRYDYPGGPRAEGIWIQAVGSPNIDERPGFYDFHIRARWQSPGQAKPVTLGTIVRLYEPRD